MSIRIAYQGRPGAYSHLACKKLSQSVHNI